jgi:hypothetical protein
VGLCAVHAIRYVEEQVNTCGLERFAKTPTWRSCGRLSERNTWATGDGIFESTRWQPVVRFAAVTVMIQSPWVPGFFPFPE